MVPDHWYPKNSKVRARIDEYLAWHHNNTRDACTSFFQTKWLQPMVTGEHPSQEKVITREINNYMFYLKYYCHCNILLNQLFQLQEADMLINKTLDELEELWLRPDSYLVTNKISIADLLAACEIEQPSK